MSQETAEKAPRAESASTNIPGKNTAILNDDELFSRLEELEKSVGNLVLTATRFLDRSRVLLSEDVKRKDAVLRFIQTVEGYAKNPHKMLVAFIEGIEELRQIESQLLAANDEEFKGLLRRLFTLQQQAKEWKLQHESQIREIEILKGIQQAVERADKLPNGKRIIRNLFTKHYRYYHAQFENVKNNLMLGRILTVINIWASPELWYLEQRKKALNDINLERVLDWIDKTIEDLPRYRIRDEQLRILLGIFTPWKPISDIHSDSGRIQEYQREIRIFLQQVKKMRQKSLYDKMRKNPQVLRFSSYLIEYAYLQQFRKAILLTGKAEKVRWDHFVNTLRVLDKRHKMYFWEEQNKELRIRGFGDSKLLERLLRFHKERHEDIKSWYSEIDTLIKAKENSQEINLLIAKLLKELLITFLETRIKDIEQSSEKAWRTLRSILTRRIRMLESKVRKHNLAIRNDFMKFSESYHRRFGEMKERWILEGASAYQETMRLIESLQESVIANPDKVNDELRARVGTSLELADRMRQAAPSISAAISALYTSIFNPERAPGKAEIGSPFEILTRIQEMASEGVKSSKRLSQEITQQGSMIPSQVKKINAYIERMLMVLKIPEQMGFSHISLDASHDTRQSLEKDRPDARGDSYAR